MKLRVCLIQAFLYLHQHNLDITPELVKLNIVLDKLNRLTGRIYLYTFDNTNDNIKLDALNLYNTIFIQTNKTST